MRYGIKIKVQDEMVEVWYPSKSVRNQTFEKLWKGCHRPNTCWREKDIVSMRWFEDSFGGYVSFQKIVKMKG